MIEHTLTYYALVLFESAMNMLGVGFIVASVVLPGIYTAKIWRIDRILREHSEEL